MATNAGRLDASGVGVWGGGNWSASNRWGGGDPQRAPLNVDRYAGTAHWRRNCWGTDFWARW